MYHKNSHDAAIVGARRSSKFVPRPVYPCYTESMTDLASMASRNDFLSSSSSTSGADTSPYHLDTLLSMDSSRGPPYLHTPTTKTYRQKSMSNCRFKERLAASTAGLKELDALREKHRRMVHEVKNYIHFSSCVDLDGAKLDHHNQERVPSPAPSANEMSSSVSYRSSLSTDSGFLSTHSHETGGHQRLYSTDSSSTYYSLPPSRKSSVTAAPVSGNTIVIDTSDDEGCYPDAPTPQLSQSYSSIPNLALASTTSNADPPPKPPFRYRRRGMQPPRPRSLYSYPEENTVTVQPDIVSKTSAEEGASTSDRVYRANRIYLSSPRTQANLASCASMTSIPSCLKYAGRWSRPGSLAVPNYAPFGTTVTACAQYDDSYTSKRTYSNQDQQLFTWDQVKRLLDPDFVTRSTLTRGYSTGHLVNNSNVTTLRVAAADDQRSTTSACSNIVCSQQEHVVVSRSVSSQSSDSSKSRKREKTWHESEQL